MTETLRTSRAYQRVTAAHDAMMAERERCADLVREVYQSLGNRERDIGVGGKLHRLIEEIETPRRSRASGGVFADV